MHDLRLVGVHEDGEHLVLSGSDGEQFLLTVDEPLRAAVRRDRAHLGQLQIQMSGDFRPREVQAQIRAGATAEEIAERSGWPLDRVRRYESAVLAEREHIADLGRGVTLRRRGSDTTPPTLAARVEQRLAARGVDLSANEWDSWRAEGGPWMLTLRFTAGGREREARWLFDLTGRTVTAQDDEALWLSEDEQPPAAPVAAPHLAAVPTVNAVPAPAADNDPDDLYDVDAEGGMSLPEPISLDAPSAVDLVGAMRQRRHGRRRQSGSEAKEAPARRSAGPRPAAEQEPLELEPLIFDPALLGDPTAPHPFPFPERLREPEGEPSAEPTDRMVEPAADQSTEPAVEAAPQPPRNFGPPRVSRATPASNPVAAPAGEPAVHNHRRSRRASVPSWDEIMFGGKRD